MDLKNYEVPVERLCWQCDPKQFKFTCTKDIAPLREFIGQERAMKAVEFGLNMENGGYNIYVAGLTGTGKTSIVKAYIERLIKEKEQRGEKYNLQDWCYLHNFKEPDRPLIAAFPQGKGKSFQSKVSELLTNLRQELGRMFSSDEYKTERQKTIEEAQVRQQKLFEEIANQARLQGFALQMTPVGPALIPMIDNRPMNDQEYLALDDTTKATIEEKQTELRKKLRESFEKASTVQQQTGERLAKADKDIGSYTVDRAFASLMGENKDLPKVVQYLNDLKKYALDNLDLL